MARWMLIFMLAVLPFSLGAAGYYLSMMLADEGLFSPETTKAWEQDLVQQRKELKQIREHTDEQLVGLTLRMAELQTRLTRLDALGERLIDRSDLDKGEFDFSGNPAIGGPSGQIGSVYQAPDIISVLDGLSEQIDSREQQLEVLDSILGEKKITSDTFVAGLPIRKGWMSSRYGQRTDPFTGRLAWHSGVDFAGKTGSDIISVASGVVTWASKRYGYGLLVEVNHGNGYKTRYAHCDEIVVKVGDVVRKGQVVALMGSTGRSTGPHVHFEVYKNGRTVDPAAYIHRTRR
ncbi:Membrane protein [Oceanobacter sp. RED65]|uniref:Membrane protein n=2 Tax=Bermanella marisrubri TaxID=207949 RepID=Q1MZP1_9GAMM|nr:M23 family metallopeptidase [Bermanella marisrubri]EAT11516.1 Membrane protein [Oceanobacter sp. RED65] [Bermanella marisrubri]